MLIDVVVCSRTGKLKDDFIPIGFPLNNIIIETSSPIGEARKKAFSKVRTPIFAIIDDDIQIGLGWFNALYEVILKDNCGAVGGDCLYSGNIFSKYLGNRTTLRKLTKERFLTSNALIKTDAIKEWNPTFGKYCYEDTDIQRYLIGKGYDVYAMPVNVIHNKTLKGVKNSAIWGGLYYKDTQNNSNIKAIREIIKSILQIPYSFILRGIPFGLYATYRNYYYLKGLLKSLIR